MRSILMMLTFAFSSRVWPVLRSISGSALNRSATRPIIGDLEDRRFFVLVDGGDDLGILHARQMLDGAGNAHRDVKIGRHHLAGLAHLIIVGHKARIDRGAAGAHRGVQPVGDLVEQLEILAPTAGRARRRSRSWRRSVPAVRIWKALRRRISRVPGSPAAAIFSIARAAAFAGRLEGGGAHGDDFLARRRLHGLDGVAGIDRALEGVGADDFQDFGNLRHVQLGGDARQDSFCRWWWRAPGWRRICRRATGSASPSSRPPSGHRAHRRRAALSPRRRSWPPPRPPRRSSRPPPAHARAWRSRPPPSPSWRWRPSASCCRVRR